MILIQDILEFSVEDFLRLNHFNPDRDSRTDEFLIFNQRKYKNCVLYIVYIWLYSAHVICDTELLSATLEQA